MKLHQEKDIIDLLCYRLKLTAPGDIMRQRLPPPSVQEQCINQRLQASMHSDWHGPLVLDFEEEDWRYRVDSLDNVFTEEELTSC